MGEWFQKRMLTRKDFQAMYCKSDFGADVIDIEANLAAIADFFNRTPAENDAAKKIKEEFASWYNSVGWWEKTDIKRDETFTKARNFRDRYNLANGALTQEQLKARQQSGATYEKAMGQPEKARTEGGLIAEPPPKPFPWKWVFLGTAAGVVAITAYQAPKALAQYAAARATR